ncbi:SpoIIE family protein phosphatase [Iamia sp. SCSIO 61187]|uniref:SpoIIE family protein phosphatase n=1 Tax=Iamia sp. SCSIO 61187 TaxID=2722752 RepID=UPI001C63197D|nr:SpoIIE family protein phosphatase [Iamia sp. SCSIO 61187]QYG92295.1 SpoIIE family protein phosphatase [Iamia sp. SCSIO 61187]
MADPDPERAAPLPAEDPDALYHDAPCGYLTTWMDGTIARVNRRLLGWIGATEADLVGRRRFPDLLRVGGKIFYETHYAPLLAMQGAVADVALDLRVAGGGSHPVVATSHVVAAAGGVPAHVRTTLVDATGRHDYERELLAARRAAEASEARVRETSHVLQQSLLQGGIEGGDGFSVETLYRPAVESLEVGGDWYDAFPLPERGTVSASVGDVVGRGLSAAAAMGQLRSAFRALAGVGAGPSRALDQLDAFVDRVPDAWMATVAAVELEPATGHLRYACAGHLPPLLVAPDGTATYLWEGRSPPLAAFPLAAPRPEGAAEVDPGGRVLVFTDGLVERQERDIDVGLEVLAAAATRLHDRPPAEMVDLLVAELLEDEKTRDDVCLLCLSRT